MAHRRRAAFITTLLLFVGVAHAADTAPLFNIAPGPLRPALERLAAQTGLQLLYDPALLEGLGTRGVAGAMTPQNALARLLDGTDVTFNFTAQDAVALVRKSRPAPVPTLSYNDRPHTITISTDRSLADLYNANRSMSATKVDESFLNVPLTSESLTRGVLQDLQVNRLEDAIQYVSGAEVAPNGQSALGFVFRGFPTYQYYLDGVRVSPDLHHDSFRDLANVERIDVVKGPASLLYGRTEPGGSINVITKQPLADSATSLEQQVGSFGYRRTQIDSGGPLPGDVGLLYRFNAAYEDQQSFRDTNGNHRIFLAPVITWKFSDATSTTLYAEYLNSRDAHDSGLPVIGNQLPPVPLQRSLEVGGDIHTTDYRVGIKGSHVFSDGWTLRHHVDARWINTWQAPQAALSDDGLNRGLCAIDNCPVNRELVSMPESRGHTYFISADALRDFSLWNIRSSVLIGADLFSSNANTLLLFKNDPSLQTDLFRPTPDAVSWSLLQDPDTTTFNITEEDWAGVYIQDHLRIGDTLHLLLGARFDEVYERINRLAQTQSGGTFTSLGEIVANRVGSIKGRGGLLWHPLQPVSLYVNYSQNLGVNVGLFEGNGNQDLLLPAEQSQEWEAGIKLESAQGRISATLAGFSLTKKNISTPILSAALDNSSTGFVMIGARNQGVEADFRGEILTGLQILASFAHIHSRIDNYRGYFGTVPPKNDELVGNTGGSLFGVPANGGSLWASYHLDGGALHGLKWGLGAVARGSRPGDNLNDYWLPGFVKIDTLAAYGWRMSDTHFEVQLNVDNLLDKRYYESLSGTRTVMPGMPRRFIATLRASF